MKAKIEAVIYASEEPVTLAQLLGLLGQEAQRALDALADQQRTLALGEEGAGAGEEGGEAGDDSGGGSDVAGEESAGADASAGSGGTHEPAVSVEEGPSAAGDGQGSAGAAEVQESAAERRAGRERERRVRESLRGMVEELMREYATSERGLEVREVAGGYRMGTKPEYHDAVRGFVRSLKPPLRLTLQALETLAVVAYKQPVTAPEISEIRGVDSGGVLGNLMGRKLVTTAGRKQVIGRPILYKTTKDFLLRFGLKDLAELPSIEEFEKMAGELAEQEEIPMPRGSDTSEERITHENLEEEKQATEPQADGDSDSLQEDESNRPGDEMPAVDGRLSGLPPSYDRPGDDPSADEAAVQSGEGESR